MKKIIFAVIISIIAMAAYCQPNAVPATGTNDAYVVKVGDNLWNVSQKLHNNPYLWEQFVYDNPFLQEPGRVQVEGPGKIFVKLFPGETLNQAALQNAPETAKAENPAPVVKEAEKSWAQAGDMSPLGWLMLFILALVVLALIYLLFFYEGTKIKRDRVYNDPITAGPPQIAAGVNDRNVESTLLNRFPNVQISNLERGRLYGMGITSYGDNRNRRTRYNGEVGYRATATYPGGRTETIYCLQACGNDARIGQGITGEIRFVPEVVVVGGQERPLTPATPATITGTSDLNKIASEAITVAEKTGRKILLSIENGIMTVEIEEKKNLLPVALTNGSEKAEPIPGLIQGS